MHSVATEIRREHQICSWDHSCEQPYGCWDLNPGPLQEQPVILTAEPFLQQPQDLHLVGTRQVLIGQVGHCEQTPEGRETLAKVEAGKNASPLGWLTELVTFERRPGGGTGNKALGRTS